MKSRKRILITFPFLLLAGIYFLGPEPARPVYNLTLPEVPGSAAALEQYVASQEARHRVRPQNEAEIVWADSTKTKTPIAFVYIHGFSASKREGDPIHRRLAKAFHANLYLARLADHGIDTTETMLLYTADRAWNSAKEALAIGKQLGEKVILVSTSTGGTLSLKLAAEYPEDVYAMINMSPNIAINNGAAFILNDPWGLFIARQVMGGDYNLSPNSPDRAPFWYDKYRVEALINLQELVESSMTKETFARVKQPTLTLYYYKNEAEQDPQVKVSAMLKMQEELGTPADKKLAVAIPDAGVHVIGCDLTSKDLERVYHEAEKFLVERVGLQKP